MLSIVICSYNRAGYITGALSSLYEGNASLQDFEVIFVDNNSSDNSLQIANEWRAAHPLILQLLPKQGRERLMHVTQDQK
jgi:glycosyltransferase involved in cell wall biosynthesis